MFDNTFSTLRMPRFQKRNVRRMDRAIQDPCVDPPHSRKTLGTVVAWRPSYSTRTFLHRHAHRGLWAPCFGYALQAVRQSTRHHQYAALSTRGFPHSTSSTTTPFTTPFKTTLQPPIERLKVGSIITGHQSLCGRGGTIADISETHWKASCALFRRVKWASSILLGAAATCYNLIFQVSLFNVGVAKPTGCTASHAYWCGGTRASRPKKGAYCFSADDGFSSNAMTGFVVFPRCFFLSALAYSTRLKIRD